MTFDAFMKQEKVSVRTPDIALSRGLLKDADERIKQLAIVQLNSKFRFEQAYECIRELADAFLARDGYKTYSHEAALAYLEKLGLITQAELERLDVCRKKRNDSKYYGKDYPADVYDGLISFLDSVFVKLRKSL
jgi:hypothetical protein